MNLRQLAKWNLLKNCLKVLDLFHWDHSRSRMWVEKVNENRFFFLLFKNKIRPIIQKTAWLLFRGTLQDNRGEAETLW